MGKLICIEGQFRSYNRHEGYRNRLVLSVFARKAGFVDGTATAEVRGRTGYPWTATYGWGRRWPEQTVDGCRR